LFRPYAARMRSGHGYRLSRSSMTFSL
jgi:hypothetical protein